MLRQKGRRAALYPEIKRLREVERLTWREIGEHFGLSLKTVHEYYTDPTGERGAERKARNNGRCADCGTETKCSGARVPPERCRPCAAAHSRRLTRAWIIESMREWHALFGVPPSAADWNQPYVRGVLETKPNYARRVIERYESTGRPWPASSVVADNFGSWANGLRAAGFEPIATKDRWLGYRGLAVQEEERRAA